jgi:hypothetical protein
MTLRIIIKYRIIIRAKQKRVMVMVVGTGQKVMPACREGPGERKERKKPKKIKRATVKFRKVTAKGAAVGVVPFASESVRHEKVVPVSSSSVCAAGHTFTFLVLCKDCIGTHQELLVNPKP